jgi:hypothetical protein
MKPCLILLTCAISVVAQTQEGYWLRLDNGARIAYQVWNGVESRAGDKSISHAQVNGHVVRRTLLNQDGSPWLGFEMHVDKTADNDFLIWFGSAAGFPFFAQAPLPRHVHDGDRVMLNVLEQPGTGKKVFDAFQLVANNAEHVMLPWPMDSPPSLLPAGTLLRLSHAAVNMGGVRAAAAQADAVLSGAHIAIDVPHVGRFSLSSAPQEGYFLDALAAGNKIEVALDTHYQIEADAPVIDQPGSWFLWVRFEPAPRSAATKVDGPPPLIVTATRDGAGADGSQPGVRLTVKNVSVKNVVAYSVRVFYVNPQTGAKMGAGDHSTFHHADVLAPGRSETSPKVTSLPRSTEGVTATYTTSPDSSVDLVVFDDGTYWGPVSSRAAQALWQRLEASGLWK